jgi:3,4-dihydroxy-2-butanone 4-phosphate synthase
LNVRTDSSLATPFGPRSARGDDPQPSFQFDAIADGLAAIRNGESIVVVDDENRENEGDLICAAQFATPPQINFMATEARGLICLAMEGERLDALDLRGVEHVVSPHHQPAAIALGHHVLVVTPISAACNLNHAHDLG